MVEIQLSVKGQPVVICKGYISKSKTPKFIGNNPSVPLQGKDVQLNFDDLQNWRAKKEDIKSEFAEQMVNNAEEAYARKSGKPVEDIIFGRTDSGRKLLKRTLNEKVEVSDEDIIDDEVKAIEGELDKLPKRERDVVLNEGMRESKKVEDIARGIAGAKEELDTLLGEIKEAGIRETPVMVSPETKGPISFRELEDIRERRKYGPKWFER